MSVGYKLLRFQCLFQFNVLNHKVIVCFAARDYFDEIDATVNVAPSGWSVQNLTIWNDLVAEQKPSCSSGTMEKSLEESEEDLEAASFVAVRSKIASLDGN